MQMAEPGLDLVSSDDFYEGGLYLLQGIVCMSKQCLAGTTETFFSMVNMLYILIGVFLLISL